MKKMHTNLSLLNVPDKFVDR